MGAYSGPLHGGANAAVVYMLQKIGSIDKIPEFIANVKAKKVKLMGFGHRVYKNYDPRARIIKKLAEEVFLFFCCDIPLFYLHYPVCSFGVGVLYSWTRALDRGRLRT